MKPELQAILDDYEEELDALSELTQSSNAGNPLSARARVAVANSTTLLLGSIFEEMIRQLAKAFFVDKRHRVANVEQLHPKTRSKLWRSGLERLARASFREIEINRGAFRDRAQALLDFCLNDDVLASVEDDLTHNDVNMRPDEIVRIFSLVGIPDVIGKACITRALIDHTGCENGGQANEVFRAALNEFYERRNLIAHALAFGSSGGPSQIQADIDPFKIFGRALASVIDGE
jgi:hypothetical protein